MTIEDLISELIYHRVALNSYDTTLVYSFHDQIMRGNGLTEKQSILATRIVKRYSASLGAVLRRDLTPFVQNPTFRLPIRKISSERRLSITNYEPIGRAIKAIFPYNEKTVENIRKSRDTIGQALWDKEEKCWFFSLNETSLQFLSTLESFEYDDSIKMLLDQITQIHNDIEKYVPMLIVEDLTPKLKNCDKNMPDLNQNDLISAIFEARKRGVCTWDETLSNFIESDEVDPMTRSFLKTDPGEKFCVDSDCHEISSISAIVANLLPVMVVVPGGDELNKMLLTQEFFKNLGIDNKDMSVMFRLPSNTHGTFNEFVKFNELNSPIDDNTKVVFVSSKIPKTIFKSGIKFNSVLNLGYSNAHYTMQNFVKNHENAIVYSKAKDIKNIRYGFM
jgi:hypothetical protein